MSSLNRQNPSTRREPRAPIERFPRVRAPSGLAPHHRAPTHRAACRARAGTRGVCPLCRNACRARLRCANVPNHLVQLWPGDQPHVPSPRELHRLRSEAPGRDDDTCSRAFGRHDAVELPHHAHTDQASYRILVALGSVTSQLGAPTDTSAPGSAPTAMALASVERPTAAVGARMP